MSKNRLIKHLTTSSFILILLLFLHTPFPAYGSTNWFCCISATSNFYIYRESIEPGEAFLPEGLLFETVPPSDSLLTDEENTNLPEDILPEDLGSETLTASDSWPADTEYTSLEEGEVSEDIIIFDNE